MIEATVNKLARRVKSLENKKTKISQRIADLRAGFSLTNQELRETREALKAQRAISRGITR